MIFNRFTREARRCVEEAVEEARALGHDSIGDEDLLLGVLASDGGVAKQALDSLGVTPEAVREEAEQQFADALDSVGVSLQDVKAQAGESFEMRNPSNRRLPFSPAAKQALESALREAVGRRDGGITGEHILLGILLSEHGQATRLLARLGVSTEDVREKLES